MIILLVIGLILLGWLAGALVNYLADVLPETRRLTPALCPGCQKPAGVLDYVLLRPCSGCGRRRSVRAWIVQALGVALILAQGLIPQSRLGFAAGAALLTYFGLVAVIDIEHRLILYVESAAGAVLGLIIGTSLHGFVPTLLGGLGGLAIMAGLYLLGWALAKGFGKLRGQTIDEEALGFGDILLGAVLGLLLGWPGIVAGVFYTVFIAGGGSLLILLVQAVQRKYEPFAPVAFGPYMLLAGLLLLYGPK